MARDGVFSYVHLDDPNKVLYMERWKDEPIPFDDIDTTSLIDAAVSIYPQLFAEDDDEDGMISFASQQFGSKIYKNRRSIKQKTWMDLNLLSFTSQGDSVGGGERVVDRTLVPPVRGGDPDLAAFLNNGYNRVECLVLQLSPGVMLAQSDVSLNSTSEYPSNTFSNLRSNSITNPQLSQQGQQQGQQQQQQQFQTPRPGRVRQVSADKFQTPIGRIMR
ncbi:hypothetical protein Cantr_09782 [Candida viswanathii]|uniref:Uncharacterized protein n=1 Tax=Candida viswanathii TaxID=5486 RepID=A0A367YBY5_9ASCO|nr:hypothetical protein Cantr_09782 [Candida viswanathii]